MTKQISQRSLENERNINISCDDFGYRRIRSRLISLDNWSDKWTRIPNQNFLCPFLIFFVFASWKIWVKRAFGSIEMLWHIQIYINWMKRISNRIYNNAVIQDGTRQPSIPRSDTSIGAFAIGALEAHSRCTNNGPQAFEDCRRRFCHPQSD